MRGSLLLIKCALYLVGCRFAIGLPNRTTRGVALAAVNVVGFAAVTYGTLPLRRAAAFTAIYLLFALTHFLLVRLSLTRRFRTSSLSMGAILFPLLMLVAVRLVPRANVTWPFALAPFIFVGLSFLSFRLSYLALEARNGTVMPPRIGDYLSFAFFAPLSSVGPIQPFSRFVSGLNHPLPLIDTAPTAALRIAVGLAKYVFLGNLVNTIGFSGLLLDGNRHHAVDLPIAMAAYYVYLYLNFSGFCDIVIGISAMVGIEIDENFDQPFLARNVKDFWNRWHITLSGYLRDTVFTPLSKLLIRAGGPASANHAIAVAIFVVFLLVGLFHGFEWHFVLFGLAHASGVVIVHYYDIVLKKQLGRNRYRQYAANAWIRRAAQTVTFAFVAATFMLFANSIDTMRKIVDAIR